MHPSQQFEAVFVGPPAGGSMSVQVEGALCFVGTSWRHLGDSLPPKTSVCLSISSRLSVLCPLAPAYLGRYVEFLQRLFWHPHTPTCTVVFSSRTHTDSLRSSLGFSIQPQQAGHGAPLRAAPSLSSWVISASHLPQHLMPKVAHRAWKI